MDSFVSPFTVGQTLGATFKGQLQTEDGKGDLIFMGLSPSALYIRVLYPQSTDSFTLEAGPTLDKAYRLVISDVSTPVPTASISVDIT